MTTYRSQKNIHLLLENMEKFWGDYKGGMGKSGMLEHKNDNRSISETR